MSNILNRILSALSPSGGSAIVSPGQTFAGLTSAVQVDATATFTAVTAPAGKPVVKFTGGAKSAATGFVLEPGFYYLELTGFQCDVQVVAYLTDRPSLT